MFSSFDLLEQSCSPCLLTNSSGRILFANPALEKLTHYARDQIVGENPRLFRSGETPDDVYQDLWSTISSGRSWRGELLNKKRTGERYWEVIRISPIVDRETGLVRYLGLLEDRTEEKRKASERERLLETLRGFHELPLKDRILPVCANCHSIRHLNGEWEELSLFLDKLLRSNCSHGICPECLRELYPEFIQESLLNKTNKSS